MRKMSSISRSRWRAVVTSASATYTLASCSRTRTDEPRDHVRARRSASHRPREPVGSRRRGRRDATRAGGGRERQHRHDVVVHPVLVDRRESRPRCLCSVHPIPGDPSPTGRARPRRSTTVSVFPSAAPRLDVSANTAAACSRSPASRCASASSTSAVSRHGLHGGSSSTANARVGHHLLGTGRAHDGAQHGPGRVERRRCRPAGPGPTTPRRRPPPIARPRSVCPVKTAIQPARTASGG